MFADSNRNALRGDDWRRCFFLFLDAQGVRKVSWAGLVLFAMGRHGNDVSAVVRAGAGILVEVELERLNLQQRGRDWGEEGRG